jgi:hypothetical protein
MKRCPTSFRPVSVQQASHTFFRGRAKTRFAHSDFTATFKRQQHTTTMPSQKRSYITSPIQAVHIDGGTEPARNLVVRGSLDKTAMATIIGNLIYKVRKGSQSIILFAYPSSVRVEVLICDGGEAREG